MTSISRDNAVKYDLLLARTKNEKRIPKKSEKQIMQGVHTPGVRSLHWGYHCRVSEHFRFLLDVCLLLVSASQNLGRTSCDNSRTPFSPKWCQLVELASPSSFRMHSDFVKGYPPSLQLQFQKRNFYAAHVPLFSPWQRRATSWRWVTHFVA